MSSNTQVHAVPPPPPPIVVDQQRRVSFSHHLGEGSSAMLREQLDAGQPPLEHWRKQPGMPGVFVCPVEGHPGLQVRLELAHSLPTVKLSGTLPAGTDLTVAERAAFRQVNQVLAAAVRHRLVQLLPQVEIRAKQGVALKALASVRQTVDLRQGIALRARLSVGVAAR